MSEDLTAIPEEPMLTAKQVAHKFQVHILTVRRWQHSGELPSYKIGKRGVRFRREDVYAFMRRRNGEAPEPTE